MAIEAFAPAKINLTLHVTGQRADGYHLLDSLVVFADLGDRITASPAPDLTLTLTITGPMAGGLSAGDDNLVMRAARLMAGGPGATGQGAALVLDKRLPLASGLGGGSSDAAATLLALARLWTVTIPANVLTLGADVPACLMARPLRMTGVGGGLHTLPHALPAVTLLLVNPGVALSTPAVFTALERRDHPSMPREIPRLHNAAELAAFLAMMRNDMEPAAIRLAPVIAKVGSALSAQPGCLIARMSGSGATCFGIFADPLSAAAAAATLRRAEPGWWVETASLLT